MEKYLITQESRWRTNAMQTLLKDKWLNGALFNAN
jgi:hypothetical protein